MKKIYVDPKTFACHMENANERIEVRTDVFDGMSDQDIEMYRLVPEGYKWTDEITGLSYTGQAVMPLENAESYIFKQLRTDSEANAQAAEKNAADIAYISMMTGVDLNE